MSDRVLIYGSRTWRDPEPIRAFIAALPADAVVIHGAALGADCIAGVLAQARGLTVEPYPADWAKHGRAAGPIRNRRMLVEGQPTRACGFRMSGESRGTDHMTSLLQAAGIPHEVVGPKAAPDDQPTSEAGGA